MYQEAHSSEPSRATSDMSIVSADCLDQYPAVICHEYNSGLSEISIAPDLSAYKVFPRHKSMIGYSCANHGLLGRLRLPVGIHAWVAPLAQGECPSRISRYVLMLLVLLTAIRDVLPIGHHKDWWYTPQRFGILLITLYVLLVFQPLYATWWHVRRITAPLFPQKEVVRVPLEEFIATKAQERADT